MDVIDSIYVTLGANQLKDKPYKKQIIEFMKCDGVNSIFNWKMSNRPKKEFVWVYIVIGGKVRWRARFVEWRRADEVDLDDGRRLKGKWWMILIDFEKLPLPYESRKGFQGFRYKN